MKEIKITVPEGYEIDRDNSTFECIKFKPKEVARPKSWEEYELKTALKDGYICLGGVGLMESDYISKPKCINSHFWFKDKDEAKAFAALGKLIQLRDAWIGDWRPDWCNSEIKYTIFVYRNNANCGRGDIVNDTLAFPTMEMRDNFYDTFKDLIEEAKMFL